ncbi:MAG: sugar ABC transporter permease [Clostridiales Family XIII bacterium]|nr:sugar ABC transporter permease [Clostridiales Family XIII bacterium]
MVLEFIKQNTMLVALIAVMVLFQILVSLHTNFTASFFSPSNVTNLIAQNGYVVILASGMLLCILTGGNIDLSVGSGLAFIGAVAGELMVNHQMNIYLTVIICLLIGVALGAWQAFWIAYIRIPPFIVTLAGMLTFRGMAAILLNGLVISPFPQNYKRFFNNYLPGGDTAPDMLVPLTLVIGAIVCAAFVILQVYNRIAKIRKKYKVESPVIMGVRIVIICAIIMYVFWLFGHSKGMPVVLITLAIIVLVYHYYTSKTVSGRYLYAMGGNEKAAIFSGVDTNKVMFFAYTNMGFLVAVAALVCVARFDSATPGAGNMYELDAIGACFIGGASAYGGVGTVSGAVIGAIFMGVLNNGMSLLGVDANWQKTVKGLVLLAAVIMDVVSQKRRNAS